MRVGLNATCFNDRPSGARQRFVGLYGALIAARPDIEFIIYDAADAVASRWFAGHPNVSARPTPIPSVGRIAKTVAALGFWRQRLRADRLDLFEQFNLPLAASPDCPVILTVHDMRDTHAGRPLPLLLAYRVVWRHALSRADHVVTVSDTIRDEVLAFRPGVAVTTIYNGIETGRFERATPSPGAPYLLAVGHLEPRKNYETLIDAIALLRRDGRALPLTIVGRDGGSLAAVRARIATRGVDDIVTLRHDVDDAALASLYAGCAAVVTPSLYEGFGIALIEAMAAGRPLLVSDIPVFRELTQDRTPRFDPRNPAAIAAEIARLQTEPGLAEHLAAYGRNRVRDFDFDMLAARLSDLYDRLIPASRPRR